MSERNWCRQDIVDTQEHKDDEEIIKTADISSQNKKQQKNIEEKWFLNQKNIVECMFAWNQFWSSDTWD